MQTLAESVGGLVANLIDLQTDCLERLGRLFEERTDLFAELNTFTDLDSKTGGWPQTVTD